MPANLSTHNITYIMENPTCQEGIGCFFKSINDISQGWLIISILLTTYVIINFTAIKNGVKPIDSFLASNLLMVFVGVISFVYQLLNVNWLITFIVLFATTAGFKVFKN